MSTKIPLAGLHHVAVRTLDYAGTMAFYRDLLGLVVRAEWAAPDGRQLALLEIGGGAHVEVIAYPSEAGPVEGGQAHPVMHLAIATSDPDGLWWRVTEAGHASVIDPKDVSLGPIEARIAFVEGPNGEVIEFFCQK